jgi:FAD/FMN-containing dehydrogenase
MVNANGKTISADEHRNAELLWASRGGGGGNFGIVTSFCVKVYPISQVAIYDISWKWKDAAKVISAWQELTPYTDERLGADLRVRSRQDGTVNATGQFVGSQFEMERLLRPLIKSATPTNVDIRTVPYIEAARKFDGVRPPHKFKNTGANVYANLSPKAIKTMLAFLRNPPSKDNLVEFQSLNGAVSRIGPRATAYFHRSAIYNLQYIAQWMHNDEQEANIEWVNALRQALVPYTVGTYVNYPDLDIINWPEAYYGANLEQLKAVKRKYDPENLFNFPQSIPLA